MKNAISLKEIADICGVSIATVSRVINNNGRFSDETAEKVRKVIEEHNYQPNQIAKGLRTNKVNIVGAIVPDITNEFFFYYYFVSTESFIPSWVFSDDF